MKPTPGPWVSGFVKTGWGIVAQTDGKCIVFAEKNDGGTLPTEADARVLAASREMLEALKEIEEQARQASKWIPHALLSAAIIKAQVAIAKAEAKE